MAVWQRWLFLGVVSIVAIGCGGSKNEPAPAPAAAPPVAAPAQPAAPVAAPPPTSTGFQELLQFVPENLKLAAGANFAALNDKSNPIGPRLLSQFQPAIGVLSRAGIPADQIERLWTGSNRETGDLMICARTKGSYDSAAATKGLKAAGALEKIGKATVQPLPAHGAYKNAVAYVDPRTLLIGRYDTIVAALNNPKPAAIRFGFDAIDQTDANYWIAGDESAARVWMGEGNGNPLSTMFGESLKIRGMGVGFGGKGQAPPTIAMPTRGFTSADDEEEAAHARLNARGPNAPGAPAPGAKPAVPVNVEMGLGMSFTTEALATSIETKYKQMLVAVTAPAGSPPVTLGGRRRDRDDDDGPRAAPNAFPAPPAGAANPLAALRMQIQRNKENVRIGMSVPAAGVPFVARFMNDAMAATGSTALADGIFDGTLSQLAVALQAWPAARPETLKGVRRFDDMRIHAGYSWMTELLPYVDRADLYAMFDFSRSWIEPQNLPQTMTVVPAFLNPADPRITWEGYPELFNGMALTHFVGMSGVEDRRTVVAAELPRSDPRAGIFGYDAVARPAEVTDGTSQTIMMIGSGEVTAPWVQGGGATIRGARAPYFHKYSGFGSRGLVRPGTFVLMADGSARTISAEIDPEVFKALCTMHGAEKIDMSKLDSDKIP